MQFHLYYFNFSDNLYKIKHFKLNFMKTNLYIKHSGIYSKLPDALFRFLSLLHECLIMCRDVSRLSAYSVDVVGLARDKYDNSDLTLLI